MSLFALQSYENNRYVCAEMDQFGHLFANRDWWLQWETFELIHLEGPRVAIKSAHNGKYVCAELNYGAQLAANRDWLGEWETFEMHTVAFPPIGGGPSRVAFKSVANGCWVCAEMGQGGRLRANRHAVGNWEMFYFH